MRTSTTTRIMAGLSALAVLGLTAGCGSDDSDDAAGSTSETSSSDTMTTEPESEDMAAGLVGPGCSSYADQVPTGPGSVSGMAQDPVTTAASNNPLLTTLTAAVSGELNPDVNLVDTLESDEFTVFAPTDDAFAALDQKTVKTLGTPAGAETLTSVLTYHVVPGQLSPDEVAGTHTTANGADLTVSGSGDDLTVGDQASVICGGVTTSNATVYLIDTVLMPPS